MSLIESVKASNNIFMGEMAVCLIIIITLIIIERYINRSDTKKITTRGIDVEDHVQNKYLSSEEMFKRSSTARSMTVKLKTMKTSDINMSDNSAIDFFKDMQEDRGGGQSSLEKTRITQQQKCKFYMHWIVLIVTHVFIFWYIPISGNVALYDSAECLDEEGVKQYGCKSFHKNPYLRLMYGIILMYLVLSALQIRYGMPTQRIASSVMSKNTQPQFILSQIFMNIPFAVEVRCLLDFTFSKTSLDIFQFWQLFQYHLELYSAKMGNESYGYKVLGSPTELLDKIIFGVCFMIVYLGLLISPIWFFSDYGGFTTVNPV